MGKVRPFCRSGLVARILGPYCGLEPKKFLQSGFAKSFSTFAKESCSCRNVRFCETNLKQWFIFSRHMLLLCATDDEIPNPVYVRNTKIHMFAFSKLHSWLIITIVVKCTALDLKCNSSVNIISGVYEAFAGLSDQGVKEEESQLCFSVS